jgi:hypothetical protein
MLCRRLAFDRSRVTNISARRACFAVTPFPRPRKADSVRATKLLDKSKTMKPTIVLLSLCLTACAHFKPVRKPSGVRHADPTVAWPAGMVYEKYKEMSLSGTIDQRAKSYEKKGHPPEEARAIAEIEYLKTGL